MSQFSILNYNATFQMKTGAHNATFEIKKVKNDKRTIERRMLRWSNRKWVRLAKHDVEEETAIG